jgi:hypothetical protein
MKQDSFNVCVCFSTNKVVLCSCTCKVGAQLKQKIICVHVLPVLYQMTLLLFNGLAEHVLVEVANAYKNFSGSLTNKQMSDMKKYILIMKQAAQRIDKTDDLQTLEQILTPFNGGTEKSKFIPPPPKDPTLIGRSFFNICQSK